MASSVSLSTYGFFNKLMSLNQTNWASYFAPTIPDGVIAGISNELQVYANSSGMHVYVKAGECRVRSHRGVLSSQITLDIEDAGSSARTDLVVARVTYGNPSTMVIAVKTGTTSVTQTAGTVWEIPLAKVTVDANVVTIAAGKVTDMRFVYQGGGTAVQTFSATSLTVANDYEYRNSSAIASLAITLPASSPSGVWMCSVCFTSGSTFSGVTFTRNGASYTPKKVGDPLDHGGYRYNLEIWWDGSYFWCAAKAV